MNTLKSTIVKLRYVHQYMSHERFQMIFGKFAGKYDLKELYKNSTLGLLTFIERAPAEIITEMELYADTLETAFHKHNNYEFHKFPHWRKVIYTQGGETVSQEKNLAEYEGNKAICSIYENADTIHSVCRMCDEIALPVSRRNNESKHIRIYEGDMISTRDEWSGTHQMILALCQNEYIGSDSIYAELLFTEKYGYLNISGEPNEDENVSFKESIFNISKDKKNKHVISMATDYKVVGNLATHFDLLKPLPTKTKKTSNGNSK